MAFQVPSREASSTTSTSIFPYVWQRTFSIVSVINFSALCAAIRMLIMLANLGGYRFRKWYPFRQVRTSEKTLEHNNLLSSKRIFEPHDIILFQIIPYLALNDMKLKLATILQPVFHAYRNIRTLPFSQQDFFVIQSNFCSTAYYNPVLRSVVMQLTGQLPSGKNGKPFRFESHSLIDNRIATPWSVYGISI